MTTILFHPRLQKRAAVFKVADHIYSVAYLAGAVRLNDARTFTISDLIRECRLLRTDGFFVDLKEACR